MLPTLKWSLGRDGFWLHPFQSLNALHAPELPLPSHQVPITGSSRDLVFSLHLLQIPKLCWSTFIKSKHLKCCISLVSSFFVQIARRMRNENKVPKASQYFQGWDLFPYVNYILWKIQCMAHVWESFKETKTLKGPWLGNGGWSEILKARILNKFKRCPKISK